MPTTNEQLAEKIGHLNGSMEAVIRRIDASEQHAAARSEKIFDKLEETADDIAALKQQVPAINQKIDKTIMPAVEEFNRMKWKGAGALGLAAIAGGVVIGNIGAIFKFFLSLFTPT
jgi:predicted  nucleic acid-binding Zn-ribbon protein